MVATFQARTALRATGIALLSMLVFLAVTLVVESYNSDRTKANIAAHRAAHVVATQYSWMFEASAHALQRIEDSVAPDLQTPAARTRDILTLGNAVRDLPPQFHYSVFDAAGNLTHSSLTNAARANVADQPYFRAAQGGTELALAPMDKSAFLMVRRLDRSGPFGGIATVSIPVATLAALTDTLNLGGPNTIALVASDGMLIARHPPIAPMDLSDWVLFTELQKVPDGTFVSRSPADGIERIIGYYQLPNWPVIALTGIDRSVAMQPFWRNLLTSALLALPILLGVGWLVHDLTHMLRVDEQRQTALSDAIERSNFLLREIHHRVKNNLQTVSSLIRLESLPPAVQSSLLGRIGAMVAVHEAMYRSDQYEEICVAPYLERLIDNIAQSHGCAVGIHTDIAHVRLSGDRAMQLGLLVNELVANAFKHAFVPRGGGTLDVFMRETDGDQLRLIVADDGPGFDPATAPSQMGQRLIDAFSSQLGGIVSVESNGATTVTVAFPKDYTTATPAPPPQPQRSAQATSTAGARSIVSMRLSKLVRSSRRT